MRNASVTAFLYSENPAIVAGFHIGFADEEIANEIQSENLPVPKAPSGRELSA